MKRTFEVAPEARADLEEIGLYLRDHAGPATASAVRRRVRAAILSIQRAPFLGVARPELAVGMRMAVVQRWVIYYRVTDDACQVVRILDGARDVGAVLGADDGRD